MVWNCGDQISFYEEFGMELKIIIYYNGLGKRGGRRKQTKMCWNWIKINYFFKDQRAREM